MKYELIVFDMDGTILDTLEDLKNSMNYTLKLHNMPERTLDEIRSFVGNGIHRLIELAVVEGTCSEKIDEIHKDFMKHYEVHCADFTRPYNGVNDLIKTLRNRGYKTAVVSNKADAAVQDLCIQYFPGLFDLAIGERPEIAKKPAADMVNLALEQLQVSKENAVYIGDSDVDVATARNSNLDMIAVDWGFRTRKFLMEQGAETIVSNPEEILELV
ncbi:MAG: HAD-IA family hydrolase [Lachnospiraceae bacterium]|nr:HAD-IA family hydrolase [Lachnospiraceae bacterium]